MCFLFVEVEKLLLIFFVGMEGLWILVVVVYGEGYVDFL